MFEPPPPPPPPPPKSTPQAPPPPKPTAPAAAAGFEVDTDLVAGYSTTLDHAGTTLAPIAEKAQALATAMSNDRKAFDTPQHATQCINCINDVSQDLTEVTADVIGLGGSLNKVVGYYTQTENSFVGQFKTATGQLKSDFSFSQ